MGFGLLDVYHSQGKSMDGMEVKNRHKLGGLKLDKIRLLSLVSHRKRLRVLGLQRQKLFHKRLRQKSPTSWSYIGFTPYETQR